MTAFHTVAATCTPTRFYGTAHLDYHRVQYPLVWRVSGPQKVGK